MKKMKGLGVVNFLKKYGLFASVALFATVSVFGFAFHTKQKVDAQGNPAAFLIGGIMTGVQGTCCNGILLGTTSVNPLNPAIANGTVLYAPGLSIPYSYYFETVPSSCAVGRAIPAIPCLDPGEECAPSGVYPQIMTIGTSVAGCSFGQAGS